MPPVKNNFLFNFAASYTGGGYKRLSEFARLMEQRGGACFIINPRSRAIEREFPGNAYFYGQSSLLGRLFNDCSYLPAILAITGKPDLYYAYGIPVYSRGGVVNWFHVSNVLPLAPAGIPISLFDRIKLGILRWKIRRNLKNADVISAESQYSLDLLGPRTGAKLVKSVNGSDDEIDAMNSGQAPGAGGPAVVVGTYRYKALGDCYRIFRMLKQTDPGLRLEIIGSPEYVPRELSMDPDVVLRGLLPRAQVVASLRAGKHYISATYIENSYNAASEGVFLCEESYISDIGPHLELLKGSQFAVVPVPGMARKILHVKRRDARVTNLRRWDEILSDVIRVTREEMEARTHRPARIGAPPF